MNVPAKPTDPMAEFQAKLKDRVRDDIRDLLPDDAVAGLVKKAVEDVFFTPRIVKATGWSGRDEERPSWFVEEVTKAAEPIIRAAVAKCVADSPQAVEKVISEFLDQNKLAAATAAQLTSMLSGMVMTLQNSLQR